VHLHSSIFNAPQRGEILVGATRQAIQRLVLGLLPELRSCEGVLREDLWQQMHTSLCCDCAAIFPTPVGWAARRLVAEWTAELRRAWATRAMLHLSTVWFDTCVTLVLSAAVAETERCTGVPTWSGRYLDTSRIEAIRLLEYQFNISIP
jgi:hypothetical protein